MGASRQGRSDPGSGWSLSQPAARVVPAVPTFAVEKGFWYRIPDHLAEAVEIGAIVRVPLSGRRVRGYVVERSDRVGDLKDISSRSGSAAVFDKKLLRSLEWASSHYVAPLPVLLDKCAPPNLPRSPGRPPRQALTTEAAKGPMADVVKRLSRGRRGPVTAIVSKWHRLDWAGPIRDLLSSGMSVVVVVATAAEVTELSEHLSTSHGDRLVSVLGDNAKDLTTAWTAAQHPGRLIIGTPRVGAWRVASLKLVVVLEEGRRAMKERQTPTIHIRDFMSARARIEGFGLVFLGPTPSLEVLARGATVVRSTERPWGLVEMVDRSGDPPGSGFLAERVVAALRTAPREDRKAFVFTHLRLGEASMRCTDCRGVRLCADCGSRLGRTTECARCGAKTGSCSNCGGSSFEEMGSVPDRILSEVHRRVGSADAGLLGAGRAISVGSERDLAGLGAVDLVVAVDADGMLMGSGHRSSEEALRILARLGNALKPGSGRRLMVQTSMPDHPLFETLKRGDPVPFLEDLLVERARLGLPPSTEMLAVEIRAEDIPSSVVVGLEALGTDRLLGPAHVPGGLRWLLMGSLEDARRDLRPMVQRWRDAGLTVRIDADPIDI